MARGIYDRGGVSEPEKKKFQRRLSHYLKDYRYRNDLRAADVAEKMGYAVPKYSELESEVKPHGRYINSLDFLAALASLDDMSVAEFVSYLDPRTKIERKEEKLLYSWEKNIMVAFTSIAIGVSLKFSEVCKTSIKEGKQKLEALIRIVNMLANRDLKTIEALEKAISKLSE